MTSGNPILDKNLDCIATYNPKLKQDLLNLPFLTHNIELVETTLGEPNLLYDKTPLHSQEGAEIEAKTAFESVTNSKLSMHIIFGIGIGHLFKEFCERSKGKVLLYEPNLEILRVTLELVDFSKELSQPNVRVVSDIETFKQAFSFNYIYNADTVFLAAPSYRNVLYADSIEDTVRQIEKISGACITEYNTLKSKIFWSIETVLDNLTLTFNETPLNEFKNAYKGKTALIVSAGPSLDTSIETIKNNRDRIVIFCVGTAFKALAQNGITPDFINFVEINDCSGQVKGFDLSEINLILEPYTNPAMHKLKMKQKLIFPTNAVHANNYWASLTGIDISPYYSVGTVSYQALASAKMLGFSKIILIGQDLAYLNNQCYSNNAAYSELVFEINPETKKYEFKVKNKERYIKSLFPIGVDDIQPWHEDFVKEKLKNLNDTLYFVKGISGEMLPTQAGYATFIEHFEGFAHEHGHEVELINSSMIGAQINGFKNVPLDEALKNSEFIKEVIGLEVMPYGYDRRMILKRLEDTSANLAKILKEFEQAKDYVFKYERELNRNKVVTVEAGKYFKLLFSLYAKINDENQDPLYQAISFNERIEIEYTINSIENVDISGIEKVYGFLKEYFRAVGIKTKTIIEKIEHQKGIIIESLNPKS